MQISIVIPLLNEEESLAELYQWLTKVLTLNRFSYEIIFVDDGSTDGSWRVIMQLAEKDAQVRGIRFLRNYGNHKPYTQVLRLQKARWSLQWTLTYKIALMKFLPCTR